MGHQYLTILAYGIEISQSQYLEYCTTNNINPDCIEFDENAFFYFHIEANDDDKNVFVTRSTKYYETDARCGDSLDVDLEHLILTTEEKQVFSNTFGSTPNGLKMWSYQDG